MLAVRCLVTGLPSESPFVGTWTLNLEKSRLEGSGTEGIRATARAEPDGAGLKATVEATTAQGQSVRYSYQITLDGRPTKVVGANFDEIETRRVNDHTFTAICKKDNQVVFTEHRAVSSDGHTITITRKGTNPQGQAYTATFVFEKQ
jgi:hypothetical protein